MFYTVYMITNKKSGEFYIGVHKTQDLNDGYMGSGVKIREAIKRTGVDFFEKKYLAIFDNEKDMLEMEATLVDDKLVKDDNCYNMKKGGLGWNILSKDARKKQKKSLAKIGHQQGENNSQHGTIWIHREDLEKSIRILKEELPQYEGKGWKRGRVVNFSKRRIKQKMLEEKELEKKKKLKEKRDEEEEYAKELHAIFVERKTSLRKFIKDGFYNKSHVALFRLFKRHNLEI